MVKSAVFLLRVAATVAVVTGMIFVANIPSHGWLRLAGAAISAIVAACLLLLERRLARRSGLGPPGRIRPRWLRVAKVLGSIALIAACVIATVHVSPSDPTIVSRRSGCGSALLGPRLPSVPDRTSRIVDDVFVQGDCDGPRHTRAAWAILSAESGLVLIALSLRGERISYHPAIDADDEGGPLVNGTPAAGLRRRWIPAVVVACLLAGALGIALTPRQVRLISYDPVDLRWEVSTLGPGLNIDMGLQSILREYLRRDWLGLAATCRSQASNVAALAPLSATIPPHLAAAAAPFAAFQSETAAAFSLCVTAAERHDTTMFRDQVRPDLLAAGSAFKSVQAIEDRVSGR